MHLIDDDPRGSELARVVARLGRGDGGDAVRAAVAHFIDETLPAGDALEAKQHLTALPRDSWAAFVAAIVVELPSAEGYERHDGADPVVTALATLRRAV